MSTPWQRPPDARYDPDVDTRPSPVAEYAQYTLDSMAALYERLGELLELVRATVPRVPKVSTPVWSATPWTVDRQGYRHMRVWCAAAVTITIDTPVSRGLSWSLPAGWSLLDLPDESTITAASSITVLVECYDQ